MAQNIKSLYAIALIASFASSVYATTCHVCNSYSDLKCRESLNYTNEFLTACDFTSVPRYLSDGYGYISNTGCMVKNVKEDGESVVIRSCYYGKISNPEKGCRNPTWVNYTTVSCNVCDTYGCNSDSYSNYNGGYEMSNSCVTKSIAMVIPLFFAITLWMS